jgi:hypothetical protein
VTPDLRAKVDDVVGALVDARADPALQRVDRPQ